MISGFAAVMTFLPIIGGFSAIGLSIYWLFNKKSKRRHLAELRKKYEEMSPTDPEYNDVRSLYFSSMLDGERSDCTPVHDHGGGGFDAGHHHTGTGYDSDSNWSDTGGGGDGGSDS